MQGQAVKQFVVVEKVFPYAVHNEMQELVLLVKKQRHGQITDLLFGVLVGRDEVDGLEVPKVDVPPEDVDIKELSRC